MQNTHKLSWFLDGRIIKVEMAGVWEEKDVAGFDRDVLSLLDQSSADSVHIIAEVSQMTGIAPISAFSSGVKFVRHPRLKWIVAVGAKTNPLVHAAASVGAKLFGVNFREEKTLDRALRFLNQMDAGLPDMTKLDGGTL